MNSLRVTCVEGGYYFFFEQAVQALGVGYIVAGGIVADRPSASRLVRLRPPTVQFGQVQSAIDQYLHTTGAAGFPWSPRCFNPDIDALHQMLGQFDVVILQEHDMPS